MAKAMAPLYPFNDDELSANLNRYRSFLAHSAIGQSERSSERSRQLLARAKKRARRRA